MKAGLFFAGVLLAAGVARADGDLRAASASNMEIIGQTGLNGHGNGGEGLTLHSYPDGRRVIFLAHESAPLCFSVIDVTRPEAPRVIHQQPIEAPHLRCNSQALFGTTLVTARQSEKQGQSGGGVVVYDVADPAAPKEISRFDTTGPHSRGVHYLTFTDGRTAWLSTGARDFTPRNGLDDQFIMALDLSDPRAPKEAMRWWMPGTRDGDEGPSVPRIDRFDSGYRLHTALVSPERPDRAYMAWIDGGLVILDIADRARPKPVAIRSFASLGYGFAHTLLPIPSRNLMVMSEEATKDDCADWPKRVFVFDIAHETAPFLLSTLPPVPNQAALCKAGGRSGAHNIHQNPPVPEARTLNRTIVAAMFNAGVRAYSIADPARPVEIGHVIPAPPPGNRMGTAQMNDVWVDENGLIYANDRFTGGLYVIRYTGSVPLD